MRSLEHLVAYGKRIFAPARGLVAHDRAPVRAGRRRSASPAPSAMPRRAAGLRFGAASRMLTVENLRVAFPARTGLDRRGARRLARGWPGEAGHRRRERVGQVHGRPRDHGAAAAIRRRSPPIGWSSKASTCATPRRAQWRDLRGGRIGMVLQDPKYSLNPVMRVGEQIEESLRDHQGLRGREARDASARAAVGRAHPRPAPRRRRLAARAVGRHGPAGDDRHDAGGRARPADRRRADLGARRHRPAAGAGDPRRSGQPSAAWG